MKYSAISLFICLLIACQSNPNKQHDNNTSWQLQTNQSELSFISTKNKNIAESHTIQFTSGHINSTMSAELILDLNQVETQIPIRNQRMKDLLFETNRFPQATITAKLSNELLFDTPFDINFSLNLHGVEKNLTATVMAQQINSGMVVTTYNPIHINAKDFGLDVGINQLTKVAKLKSISYEVPVDFKLVFHKIIQTNQLN